MKIAIYIKRGCIVLTHPLYYIGNVFINKRTSDNPSWWN
jgi:hypothetical protein